MMSEPYTVYETSSCEYKNIEKIACSPNASNNSTIVSKIAIDSSELLEAGSEKALTNTSKKKPGKRKNDNDEQELLKKRYQHSEEHLLSNYNKKQILKYFDEYGCTQKTFEKALQSYKIKIKVAQDYFNSHIEKAENNVSEECNSLCFENNTKWLEMFKSLELDKVCRFEQAGAVTIIEKNEIFPEPNELGGVDLKACYSFLSRSLYGLPQPEVEPTTAAFLSREFQLLIDAANSECADDKVREMKTKLNNLKTISISSKKVSLDPLNLGIN